MSDTQLQPTERFRQMYGIDYTPDGSVQEAVRRALVTAFDDYKEHETRVFMRGTHSWSPYTSWFPNWPQDAGTMTYQKLDKIDELIAAAQPFFPNMGLEFFANETRFKGGSHAYGLNSQRLLERADLTPQQRYLLTGNTK